MKQTINKLGQLLKTIYGWGIYIVLMVSGLCFFGYIPALIIGGDTGAYISTFLYKGVAPYLVYFAGIIVLIGLVSMYLCGEHSLSVKDQSDYD